MESKSVRGMSETCVWVEAKHVDVKESHGEMRTLVQSDDDVEIALLS